MDSSKSGNHRTVLVHYFHLCTIPDHPHAAKMVRNLIDWTSLPVSDERGNKNPALHYCAAGSKR